MWLVGVIAAAVRVGVPAVVSVAPKQVILPAVIKLGGIILGTLITEKALTFAKNKGKAIVKVGAKQLDHSKYLSKLKQKISSPLLEALKKFGMFRSARQQTGGCLQQAYSGYRASPGHK